jgi:hypothetical protein
MCVLIALGYWEFEAGHGRLARMAWILATLVVLNEVLLLAWDQ